MQTVQNQLLTINDSLYHYIDYLKIPISEFPIGNTIKMEAIKILNEAGNITRNLNNPPLKDTVSVPDAGFSLIRFEANNPGFWMIHSTTTWFHYMGMEVVLQVRIQTLHEFQIYFKAILPELI